MDTNEVCWFKSIFPAGEIRYYPKVYIKVPYLLVKRPTHLIAVSVYTNYKRLS